MRFGENILIVCTYTELAQMYQRVLKEYNMNIDVEVMDNRYGKDMQKIFDYMTQFRSKGKDLIITRGFLARQLRQHTDFKVIEIHISAVDVLSALYPLAGKDYCVGVVESEPYLKVVQKVAQILGLRTKWYPVEEVEDFEDGLRQAKKMA
ncbi:MAG TPA: PrpR N-terminal domain-containing protein [Candidatus Anaerotignum merdipullorum]|nr:PrpR N-terminal domain-containing protein [Candidatus Anaerotignum merdipullorum]